MAVQNQLSYTAGSDVYPDKECSGNSLEGVSRSGEAAGPLGTFVPHT